MLCLNQGVCQEVSCCTTAWHVATRLSRGIRCTLLHNDNCLVSTGATGRSGSRSSAAGRQLGTAASNGSKWTMARWLENKWVPSAGLQHSHCVWLLALSLLPCGHGQSTACSILSPAASTYCPQARVCYLHCFCLSIKSHGASRDMLHCMLQGIARGACPTRGVLEPVGGQDAHPHMDAVDQKCDRAGE